MLNTLPLRAIVFQFMFLLIAIAIEGLVLYKFLEIAYKKSMQYSATVNLLSAFVGWLVFFAAQSAQSALPVSIKIQLISYIFFEQFPDFWKGNVPFNLVVAIFAIFFSTYLVELGGLNRLEVFLGEAKKKEPEAGDKVGRFRGRKNRVIGIKSNDPAFALLIANACSFTIILILLVIRYWDQTRSLR